MTMQVSDFEPTTSQTFPRSVLSVSREEFGDRQDNPNATAPPLQLNIKDITTESGTLPADLQGHIFIVGPVGSVDSRDVEGHPDRPIVFPAQSGTTLLYNGDGMIYRLDFDTLDAGVFLSSRLVKPPCYYADIATHRSKTYQGGQNTPDLRFKNYGITRLSAPLGIRNQLNTAFLPMQFAGEPHERLLVAWDMGRPYEIDPKTLETVTPVGWNHEWQPVTKLTTLPFDPPAPFQAIQTSAHPCFDPNTGKGEMITVNCGRSLANLVSQLIPIIYLIREILGNLFGKQAPDVPADNPTPPPLPAHLKINPFKHLLQLLIQLVRGLWEFWFGNFLDVVVWDGSGRFKTWRVLCQGKPISIRQSTHQLGITEDYIVVMDTAFKVSVEELLPHIPAKERRIEDWARSLLDHPQLSKNFIYIVRRRDLQPGVKEVAAQKVIIPEEVAHFWVDYPNPNHLITLHLAHVCAWDAGECVSEFDFDDAPKQAKSDEFQRLYGVLYSPTDISRLGYYVVNGETGELLQQQQDILMDLNLTWGPAISSYRAIAHRAQIQPIEDIYWGCLGCWNELLLPHILDLYDGYPYRQAGLQLIQEITKQGRKSNVLRVHINSSEQVAQGQKRLTIADAYEFPNGYYVTSPQFIPSSQRNGSTDGYIVCIVHFGDGTDETNGNEIWVLDATNLKKGPICKLWHPQMNFGFTVHAAWMQTAHRRTATYHVPVEADYASVVAKQPSEIQDLFKQWVYPQKEPPA